MQATWREALALVFEIQAARLQVRLINYNCLLGAFASDANWKQAICLLGKLVQMGTAWNVVSCNSAANACILAQQWLSAASVLASLAKRSVRGSIISQNTALQAQKRGMRWQSALISLERLLQVGMLTENQTMNTAISACSCAWEVAAALLGITLVACKLRADVFTFAGCLAGMGGGSHTTWVLASNLMQGMCNSSIQGNVVCQSSAITALERGEQWHTALQLLRGCNARFLRTNLIVFNAAMSALSLQGSRGAQWQQSLGLLAERRCTGKLRRDVVTYNAAASACQRCWQWQNAWQLLRGVRDDRLQLSAVTYAVGITSCSMAWRWQEAFVWLVARTHESGLKEDAAILTVGIDACARSEQWEWAFRLQEHGISVANVRSHCAAVSACESGGCWRPVSELLARLQCRSIKLHTAICNAAISTCEKAQKWRRCLTLLCELRSSRLMPDLITYNSVMAALAGASTGSGKALALLSSLQGDCLRCNLITWNAAITACGSDWLEALELFKNLEQNWRANAITYSETATSLTAGGQPHISWLLYAASSRAIQDFKGLSA